MLRGELVDTNSAQLSELLGETGFSVKFMLTVGDRREDLVWAIEHSLIRADYLFISGGLGPTTDDLTTEVVANYVGVALEFHEPSWAYIEGRFREFKIPLTDNNRKQAFFPAGARILPNPNGTAPGFVATVQRAGRAKWIVALPGPPREMLPMAQAYVASLEGATRPSHQFINFFGIGESSLGAALMPWIQQHGEIGFRHIFPEVQIKIYDASEATKAELRQFVRRELADYLIDFSDRSIPELFASFLQENGLTFATAESCTGGLISKLVTDAPGASAYFRGGVVAYDNSVKTELLDVDPELIQRDGAVSESVAMAMAANVRQRLGTDLALSVTGIAGPDGGSQSKPVGTVWLGRATKEGVSARKARVFPGRERVRICSAHEGLRWLMADWLSDRWAATL